MLKVAHIVTTYQSAVTILDTKLRELDKFDDLDITAISSAAEADDSRKPAVRHIPLEMSRGMNLISDIRAIWQLYNIIKKEKFDIVHSHTSKAGFVTAIAGKMAKVPIKCHTHHGIPFFHQSKSIMNLFYMLLEKIVYKFRDYILAQTRRGMSHYINLKGEESRVLFEGNGVDVDYVKQSATRQLSEALEDFPCEGLKLVLLSRMDPVKRIDLFLDMIDKLKRGGMQVSSVIAGTGPLEKHFKNQIVKMHLQNCVNMIGFTNRPHGLLAVSDIVLLCSDNEGIPRVIMEAMALQKPVVATDVWGTQELVVDGETGFLVPLGNVETMAEKIRLLAADPELRKKMGANGFKRVNEHFNDVKIARFLHDFYISKARERSLLDFS